MEFSKEANQAQYPFELPILPYPKDSLSPYMSAETLEYHHGKHHLTYVNNLNNLLKDNSKMHSLTLEKIIQESFEQKLTGIFNNAAQIWNHSFFWHCLRSPGNRLDNPLVEQIKKDFGSFEEFKIKFKELGMSQFGSGWVWLVMKNEKLEIVKTSNAESPITENLNPIFTCDVWEHAYYIDYRNKRVDFLDSFIEHLINWDFANKNFMNINKSAKEKAL